MLDLFVIRWRNETTGQIWESERCATSAKEALVAFRKGLRTPRLAQLSITVLGISDADGRASLQLV